MITKRQTARFTKGSGVFTCHSCKRATRDTGGDNTDLRLCAECYEIGGIENQISDNPNSPDLPKWEAEVAALQAKIVEKGGTL